MVGIGPYGGLFDMTGAFWGQAINKVRARPSRKSASVAVTASVATAMIYRPIGRPTAQEAR